MKILLATSISLERFNVTPDIGLGYLAAIARDGGHEVRIVDCLLEAYSQDDWERLVADFQPALVGIKAYSIDIEPIREMLERVRRAAPAAATAIGGPHPSSELPHRLFAEFPELDYAIAGEGEPGWPRLLDQLGAAAPAFDVVPGLIWRDASGAVRFNERARVRRLDALPLPAWGLLQPERYPWGYSFMTGEYPAAPMSFTRGCPQQCTYCSSHHISGRSLRRRSADSIVEEMRLLKADHGVRTIDVVDENCVADRDHMMALCEAIAAADLGMRWNCPYGVRLDNLDAELLHAMERAGCFGFSCGIESGSNRVLASVRKATTVEVMREKVHLIKRETRMIIQGFFMMGFPGETAEEIEQTIRFACQLPIDIAVFSPLRISPGTEMYQQLVREGVIDEVVDFSGMGHHYFVRSYGSVSDEDMQRLYRKAYRRFYGRPAAVYRLLRLSRTPAQRRTLFNGLRRLAMRPFERFDFRKAVPRSSAPVRPMRSS